MAAVAAGLFTLSVCWIPISVTGLLSYLDFADRGKKGPLREKDLSRLQPAAPGRGPIPRSTP